MTFFNNFYPRDLYSSLADSLRMPDEFYIYAPFVSNVRLHLSLARPLQYIPWWDLSSCGEVRASLEGRSFDIISGNIVPRQCFTY